MTLRSAKPVRFPRYQLVEDFGKLKVLALLQIILHVRGHLSAYFTYTLLFGRAMRHGLPYFLQSLGVEAQHFVVHHRRACF